MSEEQPGSGDRANLLKYNREKIEYGYVKAIADGQKEPVVLVMNMEDTFGLTFAEQHHSKEFTSKVIEEARKEGMMPTFLCVLPRLDAHRMLRELQKLLHERNPAESRVVEQLSEGPPAGMFYAVAVSFGKNIGLFEIP